MTDENAVNGAEDAPVTEEVTHLSILQKLKADIEGWIAKVEGIDGGKFAPEEADAVKAGLDAAKDAIATTV